MTVVDKRLADAITGILLQTVPWYRRATKRQRRRWAEIGHDAAAAAARVKPERQIDWFPERPLHHLDADDLHDHCFVGTCFDGGDLTACPKTPTVRDYWAEAAADPIIGPVLKAGIVREPEPTPEDNDTLNDWRSQQ